MGWLLKDWLIHDRPKGVGKLNRTIGKFCGKLQCLGTLPWLDSGWTSGSHLDWRDLARLVGAISRMTNGRWRTIIVSNVLINHKLTGKMAKKNF